MTLTALMGMLALGTNPQAAQVRAGAAAVDITPPLGIPLAGYYHARAADGVLDPLYAKALVIEAGGERIAIVAVDLISVTRAVTDEARRLVEQTTGIPGRHVMVAATHTHTAPALSADEMRVEALGAGSAEAREYTRSLPKHIAEAVRLANSALRLARLRAVKARCDDLTFNRRYFLRDGSVGWNPGKLNPDIMLPAGPTDAELHILSVEQPEARGPADSLATLVNFAMHTDTTGGTRLSADWPGALARVLAAYHGPHHVTGTLLGACGNLNHLDTAWNWPQSSPAEQHRIGVILGAAVFQAYKRLQPVSALSARAASEVVELALVETTPEEVETARKVLAAVKEGRQVGFMEQVRAFRILDVAERKGTPYRVEVQALALGTDVAWVSLPGEVFAELGLAIKKQSPFKYTFVVTLANENIGYIPDRRSYAEGNYEPESARCAPGSGERLADAAVRLLTGLHAQAKGGD